MFKIIATLAFLASTSTSAIASDPAKNITPELARGIGTIAAISFFCDHPLTSFGLKMDTKSSLLFRDEYMEGFFGVQKLLATAAKGVEATCEVLYDYDDSVKALFYK